MRFGVCTLIENICKLEQIGYDYIEVEVVKIASMTEGEFETAKKLSGESRLRCEAFNTFFPASLKITGPDVDRQKVDGYIVKAVGRIAALGGEIAVLGSGGARNVPEGWDMGKGLEQYAETALRIGQEASKYGITIVVEPLNRSESNIINSVKEGYEVAKSVNHPNVKLLADFYHIMKESEPMEYTAEAADFIRHTHIANSNGRIYMKNRDEDAYDSFFDALKRAGYNSRVSVETNSPFTVDDATTSLKLLKELVK